LGGHRLVGLEGDPCVITRLLAGPVDDQPASRTVRGPDPRLGAQVGHRQSRLGSQRVLLGQHGVVDVVDEVLGLELGAERAGHHGVVIDQGEVDVARPQECVCLLGLCLDHAKLDLGVARVRGRDAPWDQRGACALERGQAKPAAAQPGELSQLVLGALEAGQDRIGMCHQHPTGIGEPYAARCAVQEL